MKRAKDVDEYIAMAPKELQSRLKVLRKTIKMVVPKAEEKISYAMPYYGYCGRLAYFGLFKNHIGLYIPGSVVKEYKNELKDYGTSTATVRFPHDKKTISGFNKKID